MNFTPRLIVGLIFIVLGLSFFLDFNVLALFWPLLLIFIGVSILTRKPIEHSWDEAVVSEEDELDETVIFWGVNKKITSDNFRGGKVAAIFGGGKIDLSEANMKEDEAEMEVVAVFGGMEVVVPKGWSVSTSGAGVFGGFNNNTKAPKEKGGGRIKIEGAAVFGGVNIRNG
ncbi:MAG: hypothetical protein ACOX6N_02605 [Patescibacteria group bacterium]|jgi:predicted membrane protein